MRFRLVEAEESIFRYPPEHIKKFMEYNEEDGYKLEVVPLKKIVDDTLSKNNPNSTRVQVWGNDPSKYALNSDKIKEWDYSDIIYGTKKKNGDILLADGRHRCIALYNAGYDAIEIPLLDEADLEG